MILLVPLASAHHVDAVIAAPEDEAVVTRGVPVQFLDGSPAPALCWKWNLGGGTLSEERHPVTTYTRDNPDHVQVTLVAMEDGCRGHAQTAHLRLHLRDLSHAHLEPASAEVEAGGTTRLALVGHDERHEPVPIAAPEWSATCGTVDATGLFTAPIATGACEVTATTRTETGVVAADTVTVTVVPGPLDHYHVEPERVTVRAGESAPFGALAHDRHHNLIPIAPDGWSATCGTIAPDGTYTAPTALPGGECAVRAEATNGAWGAADVAVEAGPAATLEVRPVRIYLSLGESTVFEAVAHDAFGNLVPRAASWRVVTPSCGEITAGGVYTAPEREVDCHVLAEVDDESATALAMARGNPPPVPEPSTVALVAAGLVVLGLTRRWRA